jgi:hypothetical protein
VREDTGFADLTVTLWLLATVAEPQHNPEFVAFPGVVQEVPAGLSTSHTERLKTLMTFNLQLFDKDVSLTAK